MKVQKSLIYGVFFALMFSVGVAFADSPAFSNNNAPIYLNADQTRLFKLDQDAASVIVANPIYANVMVDTPRNLVIIPRQIGSTTFSVLNQKGDIITTQRIVVGAVKQENYVRIRRACSNAGDSDCAPVTQYYCPDGCHEIYVASNISTEDNSQDTSNLTGGTATIPAIPAPEQ